MWKLPSIFFDRDEAQIIFHKYEFFSRVMNNHEIIHVQQFNGKL